MATEVSRPPANASTIRFTSRFRIGFEAFDERGRPLAVARDDQNGVIPGNRADRFLQLRAIERFTQRLRLPSAGPQDDELLPAFDTPQERRGCPFERRSSQFRARG